MKIARFNVKGLELHGKVDGDRVYAINGDIFRDYTVSDLSFALSEVKLLPPTKPVHYWGVGENYAKHVAFRVEQYGDEILQRAKRISPWHKSAGCLLASGDPVMLLPDCDLLEYEGELCVVIGKPAFRVSEAEAPAYVFGYTVTNDVSGEGAWHGDLSHWRRKGTDTFGPIGPWIETEIQDHQNLQIITRVNGKVEDEGSTKDMVHSCFELISFISQQITLHPGDIITTGAPGLTRPLNAGEVVEVEIPEIGVLRNPIVAYEGQ